MDFINQAKQLANTVRDKFQAGANNAADNIDGARSASQYGCC